MAGGELCRRTLLLGKLSLVRTYEFQNRLVRPPREFPRPKVSLQELVTVTMWNLWRRDPVYEIIYGSCFLSCELSFAAGVPSLLIGGRAFLLLREFTQSSVQVLATCSDG